MAASTLRIFGRQTRKTGPVGGRRKPVAGVADPGSYSDIPGFCKSVTTAEIAAHGHVLTPGRYVGAEEIEDDGEPFEKKMPRLVSELESQFAESARLQTEIRSHLSAFK